MSTQIVQIDVEQISSALASLKRTADTIAVKDAPTCLAAKTAQRDVRNYMKDVHLKLDPFVEVAKRNLQETKDELNKWLEPAQAIDAALALKVKDFERQEREAAEAETRRQNEERRIEAARKAEEERQERNRIADAERKERERVAEIERKEREKELARQREAGEINKREMDRQRKINEEKAALAKKEAAEAQAREKERAAKDAVVAAANVVEVKVEANIPTVAGVPSRRNWKFRIVDANRIPRQYLMPNEVAIGAFVRNLKKEGEVIPGIESYLE